MTARIDEETFYTLKRRNQKPQQGYCQATVDGFAKMPFGNQAGNYLRIVADAADGDRLSVLIRSIRRIRW